MLTLFEELYLLTIRDDQSVIDVPIGKRLRAGMLGAILAELALRGIIQVNQNRRLEVTDATTTGDATLDKAARDIKAVGHPHKFSYWVKSLNVKPKKLQKVLVERLTSEGVFHIEEENATWVIPSGVCPEINATAKYCIKTRLRSIVLAGQEGDLRSLALLSIAQAAGMLNYIFTKDERREVVQKIHEMLVTEAMNNPTAQIIEEIQTAVAAI